MRLIDKAEWQIHALNAVTRSQNKEWCLASENVHENKSFVRNKKVTTIPADFVRATSIVFYYVIYIIANVLELIFSR